MIFEVIGAPGAAEYLEQGADPCFGKVFAKSAQACIDCRCPVLMGGKIRLMREVCAAKSRGAESPMDLQRLTSQDVLQRLERGEPLPMIFAAILADAPPELAAASARQLLMDRLVYLKSTGLPVPEVPRAKELLKEIGK